MVYYSLNGYNSDMFMVGLLSWWYGDGFVERFVALKRRLVGASNLFSVKLLLATLFSPYKQLGTGKPSRGTMADKLHAISDRLVSRMIGFAIRTITIVTGLLVIVVEAVLGILIAIVWLIAPMIPVIGLIIWVVELSV